MGFSRQEYWHGLPFPPPGDLSNPGVEPESLMSLVSAGRFFTTSATWKAHIYWMLKKLFDEIMKENMCMSIAPSCFLSLSSCMEHECDAKVHPEPWILDDRMER